MLTKKAKRREEARMQEMRTQGPETETQPVQHVSHPHKGKAFFDQHYKHLMLIPSILIILALLQIGYHVSTTGDFVTKSVSLSGGAIITIPAGDIAPAALQQALATKHPDAHIQATASAGNHIAVQSTDTDPTQVEQLVSDLKAEVGDLPQSQYTVEIIGASLGQSFFRQTMISLLIAFAFMSAVVFIAFRSPAPTGFVVLAAACDILSTLAVFNLLGQQLTIAGIAAFLMLIGYSIDTDVLLTTRV